MKLLNRIIFYIVLIVPFGAVSMLSYAQEKDNIVKVTGQAGHWQLNVNDKPYYIKGVGLAHAASEDQKIDYLRMAKDLGANTVRTWGISGADQEYLDKAHAYGLMVDFGFWLNFVYPNGSCSYITDQDYMSRVWKEVVEYVTRFRHHPAILAWNVGNETIFWTKDEKERVACAIFLEKLIQKIHELDPNHPVIYTSAYIHDMEYISKYTPSLDILGINVYGDVEDTHRRVNGRLNIPIVFTEFGPTGPWDLPKDAYERPIEINDKVKADLYEREARLIFSYAGYNLGGFVFNIGETTQTSLTWWNLNYKDLFRRSFYRMKDFYLGIVGSDEGMPFVESISLSKVDHIRPGEALQVNISVAGEASHFDCGYMMSTEIDADLEEKPNYEIPTSFRVSGKKAIFKAPSKAGMYRVYGFITDKKSKYFSVLSQAIKVGD